MKITNILLIAVFCGFILVLSKFFNGQVFLYSLLLLFLIFPIFYQSSSQILTKLKYLLIWFVIFAIIFVIVSYREDFFNSKIIANLIPGHAEYNEKEMIFYAANDGHFYIDTKVNGRKIMFLLDTGASDIILSKYDAVKLGFDLEKLNYNKLYFTANGKVKAASVVLDRIIVGDMEFRNIRASVNNAEMQGSLLGMSF